MQLTNLVWLTAALGAAAHPSGHAHKHRAFHDANEKRDVQFVKAERQTLTVYTTVEATAGAAAATTSSSTPAPTTTPTYVAPSSSSAASSVVYSTASSASSAASSASSSSSSSSSSGSYVEFCSGSSKRATLEEIAYTGNTGTTWGCNIMLVDADIADLYNYTTTYSNSADEDYEVVCFNKIGPDGGINGFFGNSAVTFTLSSGQSQVVAFQANSQGACAFGPSSVPKTTVGEWAGTWVEFDFANTSNNEWSGADCSSLVAQAAGMDVYGCQVCHDSTCSTIYSNGQSDNAYVKGTEAADGIGLNIPAGNAALKVSVGYSA